MILGQEEINSITKIDFVVEQSAHALRRKWSKKREYDYGMIRDETMVS